jgi:glycosyltransferase involved in cell wall biosynthesis
MLESVVSEDCICMFTPTTEGGHARYAWELMNALAQHPGGRYRFELVSSRGLEEQFQSDRYAVHAILPPLVDRAAFATRPAWVLNRLKHYPVREWQFLKWLKNRPDIVGVHFQEWTPWLAAPLFRRIRRMGKKVFYTVHNVVPHKYPAYVPKAVMDRWIRRACLLCDCLFVHTDRLAGELAQSLGDPHPPIQVSPHGIWTVPDHDQAPALAERLAWKKLLFFGSIRRNKGLDLLLQALEWLPDYSLTIAGEPTDESYFQSEILPQVRRLQTMGRSIDLQDRFTPEAQVGALFNRHGAIVLPYTRQFVAQSGVVFLALAYDLPVIASEAGGLRDLFDQFQIGTTFGESTPQALAEAVRALHDGAAPEILQHMRATRQHFSWPASAAATLAGYSLSQEGRDTHDCAVAPAAAH